MLRAQAKREMEEARVYRDGSVDSSLTKSAASLLESVEAYLAERPEWNGVGRIPPRSERSQRPA